MTKRKDNLIFSNDYIKFLNEIKDKITSARNKAAYYLNKELIKVYFEIGKTIVDKQKQYRWGKSVLEKLAKDLQREFNAKRGYSAQNLWYMRQFYLEYCGNLKLQQLVGEIPWSHNILIFSKIKDKEIREYYLKAAIKYGWTRNVLLNQIKANAYNLYLKNPKQHNFHRALPVHVAEQANEAVKDIYSLDFLGITKPVLERELEQRLIERIKYFILELGVGFAFVGNQHKLVLGKNEYFIDLLFFNRRLKCLVAIELKTGKFEPEYSGKMDFYLNLLNDQAKFEGENPPIGIVLCAEKDKVVVEYALRGVKNPIGISQYHLTAKLPKNLKGILPSGQQLEAQIKEEF